MILNCSSATLLQSWSDLNFISNIEWSLISWLVVTCQYPSTWTFSNPLKQALISHFRIYPDCRGSTLFRRCRKWHSLLCPLGKLMRIQYSKRKYGEVAICILCSTRHVTTYTWDSVEADCLVDKLRPDLFGLSCFQVLYECNCCSLRHCTPHWDKEGQRECKWPQNPRHPWTVQRRSPQPNRGTHGVWVVEAQLPRVATRLSEGRHPWLRWWLRWQTMKWTCPTTVLDRVDQKFYIGWEIFIRQAVPGWYMAKQQPLHLEWVVVCENSVIRAHPC